MSDRVTWLLPVLNGMPFLPETLHSIETQIYRDWEVLAWDNGSNDGTLEELKRWIPDRLPGRVVAGHPLRLGASLARMVDASRTELCARIDADDINLPDRLVKQVDFLNSNPNVALVGSQMSLIDRNGQSVGKYGALPLVHEEIVSQLLYRNPIAHPTVLFRRSSVLDARNYQDVLILDGNYICVEDYDLWLRLARRHRLANLSDVLVKYRVHERSATQVSIRNNILDEALCATFCSHSLDTYGCDEADARLLRTIQSPRNAATILSICRFLEKTQPDLTAKERLATDVIQELCDRTIPPSAIGQRTLIAFQAKGLLHALQRFRNGIHWNISRNYWVMRSWLGSVRRRLF